MLSRIYGVRQVVTVRGESALAINERGIRPRVIKRLLPKADQVVTLSDRLKSKCVAIGVPEEQIQTVHNGVDSTVFTYRSSEECREILQLPDHKIIVCVGFVTPNKGFDRIIEALPELNRHDSDVRLFLIGPTGEFAQGDCSKDLERLADQLGVADKVTFVGEIDNCELPLWYNSADCFCLSSRSEGCPNVFLRGAGCGCPCVATNVGSVPDIMDHSMGKLVPNTSEGIRDGLLEVLSRSFDRRRLAERMTAFDWDSCAGKNVLDVYKRLLTRPGEDTD